MRGYFLCLVKKKVLQNVPKSDIILCMKSVGSVPKFLFPMLWDVKNPGKLDIKKYQGFIIARVAEKGGWAEIQWLKKTYGIGAIKRVVARSKNVNKKIKNFWKII